MAKEIKLPTCEVGNSIVMESFESAKIQNNNELSKQIGGYSVEQVAVLEELESQRRPKFMRVADRYYQHVPTPCGTYQLKHRDKRELKDDGVDFREIKKYHGFTVEHNFREYRYEVNGWLNLSEPLPCKPIKGAYGTIIILLAHLFGMQLDLFLDYLTIMVTRPQQKLPIVVLTSRIQGTGKTTLFYLLRLLFGENSIIMNVSQYSQQFNALYASKLIICIDETAIKDEFIKERIKQDSTADSIQLRKMHAEHETLPFFGKFFLATNKELDFAQLDEDDIRFWVIRVPKLESYDPDFNKKLESEAPAFLFFILNRKLSTEKPKSRQWFSREQLRTDALDAVILESRSKCAKDVEAMMEDKTDEFGVFQATASDIYELIGKRYSVSEIRKALKNELKLNPEHGWYSQFGNGAKKAGRCYTFRSTTAPSQEEEGKEGGMPF